MNYFLRFQAPLWIPYRWRQAWDQWRVEAALKAVLKTKPVIVADPGLACAEVHMLLCRRDMLPGIVALKSLLHAIPHPLAVSLTNDGTLTAADRSVIERHFPGARWLTWPDANLDLADFSRKYPRLAGLYSGPYQPSAKLLHPILLGRTSRVIVVDPDTVSWRKLQLLSDWVMGAIAGDLHLEDLPSRIHDVPPEVHRAFQAFSQTLATEHRRWQIKNLFFNSGLLVFSRSQMCLDVAEQYLEWHAREAAAINCPLRDIWFGGWTPEQTCYLVMYATQSIAPHPLGEEYVLGYHPERAFNHFLRTGLIQPATLFKLRTFLQQLA